MNLIIDTYVYCGSVGFSPQVLEVVSVIRCNSKTWTVDFSALQQSHLSLIRTSISRAWQCTLVIPALEREAERSEVQCHPRLHAEFEPAIGSAEHIEVNLCIMRYPRTHFLLNVTNCFSIF